ncbi:DUF1311 domain-containing protein [Chitinophaga sp. Mgbs1]|uniref:DUF1311 domain-containing protein n=1 Tax=Chitinophaga solisilvae TaxID=1233460 RepID=A0A9Q5GS99_9BACT|nr:DUF1311 domain-containing protein [Chitinophaga solisilvae]
MKSFVVTLLLVAASVTGFAQSQAELNKKAEKDYREADKELNTVYQQIVKDYAANKNFLTHLKDAQKVWIQLRDAQVKMMFPESAKFYGSVFPMCKSNYLTELTHQRIETLRTWLSPHQEGDVCSGSIGARQ